MNYISYDNLSSLKNKKITTMFSLYSKKEVKNFLSIFKSIYNNSKFPTNITGFYNGLNAVFDLKNLTLIITKNDIYFKFIIKNGLLKYTSYTINNFEHFIQEYISFKLKTFEIFSSNIETQFKLNKKML